MYQSCVDVSLTCVHKLFDLSVGDSKVPLRFLDLYGSKNSFLIVSLYWILMTTDQNEIPNVSVLSQRKCIFIVYLVILY